MTRLGPFRFCEPLKNGGNVEKVGVEPDPKRVGPASWNLEHGLYPMPPRSCPQTRGPIRSSSWPPPPAAPSRSWEQYERSHTPGSRHRGSHLHHTASRKKSTSTPYRPWYRSDISAVLSIDIRYRSTRDTLTQLKRATMVLNESVQVGLVSCNQELPRTITVHKRAI